MKYNEPWKPSKVQGSVLSFYIGYDTYVSM